MSDMGNQRGTLAFTDGVGRTVVFDPSVMRGPEDIVALFAGMSIGDRAILGAMAETITEALDVERDQRLQQ